MDLPTRIAALIEPTLTDMGYELVRVQLQGTQRQTLQIMAERASDGGMAVHDCEAISRAVSAIMDVEDPIPEAYMLEVSSPGVDRPLTRRKDFTNWVGFDAKVEAPGVAEGRKRYTGRLLGFDAAADSIRMDVDGEEVTLPFAAVSKAKLVLNDRLLAWAEAQQSENDNGAGAVELDATEDNNEG